MGSLKDSMRSKVESGQERGEQIKEIASQKIEEATASAEALNSVEAIDDDDKAAVESARSASSSIAQGLAESEIKSPGAEVGEGLKETSVESQGYSEVEKTDAGKAAGMTADYSGVGSSLASSLEQSSQEFSNIASQSEQINNELQSAFEQMASQLGGTFG
ncbi:MAG: hypothetical protein ACI4XP_03980 [Acutalibacteraceae bacterium]